MTYPTVWIKLRVHSLSPCVPSNSLPVINTLVVFFFFLLPPTHNNLICKGKKGVEDL